MTIQKIQQGPSFGHKGYMVGSADQLRNLARRIEAAIGEKERNTWQAANGEKFDFEFAIAKKGLFNFVMSIATGERHAAELRKLPEGISRAKAFESLAPLDIKKVEKGLEAIESGKGFSNFDPGKLNVVG